MIHAGSTVLSAVGTSPPHNLPTPNSCSAQMGISATLVVVGSTSPRSTCLCRTGSIVIRSGLKASRPKFDADGSLNCIFRTILRARTKSRTGCRRPRTNSLSLHPSLLA